MLGLFGKKKEKPQSEAQMMADMLSAMEGDQQKKGKRRARRGKRLLPSWVDRRILIGLAVIVIAIIADGVRRENQEFCATVTSLYGSVEIHADTRSPGKVAKVGAKLSDRNVIRTGAQANAVLEFPDGSVVTVGPYSQMVVKLLEYNRGGAWRSRAFFLYFGQMWARVSPNFGEKSEMKVYTPSSVAAVRGTTFSVSQAPKGGKSDVLCSEGTVEAQGFRGAPQNVTANNLVTVAAGDATRSPRGMAADQAKSFSQSPLVKDVPPQHWLKTFELAVTQALEAPLNILGIGKCSWGVGAANFARRAAAQEQLRRIHANIEGSATYPAYVNPATIHELGIPERQSQLILSKFHGDALELYRQLEGGKGFIIFTRAKDPKRTLYKLTPYGVEKGTEDELRQYRS